MRLRNNNGQKQPLDKIYSYEILCKLCVCNMDINGEIVTYAYSYDTYLFFRIFHETVYCKATKELNRVVNFLNNRNL